MKFTNCSSSVAFFVYCIASVLVIVSGQPTTDDVIDCKDELINKLIDTVAELRAEQQRSAAQFTSRINNLENGNLQHLYKTIAKLVSNTASRDVS